MEDMEVVVLCHINYLQFSYFFLERSSVELKWIFAEIFFAHFQTQINMLRKLLLKKSTMVILNTQGYKGRLV